MDKLEKAQTQGRIQHAVDDTVKWSGKFIFMIIDTTLSVVVALISESVVVGFVVFLVLIIVAFLIFLDLAPTRQRDILRNGYSQLKTESEQEIQTLAKKLKERQPNFVLREARNVGHGFNLSNDVINFQAELVVCNNGGSASAITKIEAHIQISEVSIELDRVDRSKYDNFVVQDENSSFEFEPMDFLDEKTIEKPIKQGACKIGMVVYEPRNSKDAKYIKDNVNKISAFVVIFTDVYGKRYPFSLSKISQTNIPQKNYTGTPTRMT